MISQVAYVQNVHAAFKGLSQPEKLTKEQRNEILKIIRFTDEDISYLSEELKDELLKDGAVKVDTVIEDVAHIY